MKIKVRLTADVAMVRSFSYVDPDYVVWPDGWPVPRVDDVVNLPDITFPLVVKSVRFLPEGDDIGLNDPYIAVAVGKYRP